MRKWLKTAIILALGLCQCQEGGTGQNQDAKANQQQMQSERIIVMGIDDTGSYSLWDQAKNIAVQIVIQLEPGDVFYLRRITGASYADEVTIFRLELPRIDQSRPTNPFDRRAKSLRKVFATRVQHLKEEAIERIANLQSTKARSTDIFGFVAVASEKFSLLDKQFDRVLVIASDLQDNVHYEPDLDLSGASVGIVGFQAMQDPKGTQQLKNRWHDLFSNAGARKIIFIRTDEKLNLDDLQR